MLKSATIDEQAKTLTLVLDLDPPKASASGKTVVIASTRGNAQTEATLNGRPITVGVNAYFKP